MRVGRGRRRATGDAAGGTAARTGKTTDRSPGRCDGATSYLRRTRASRSSHAFLTYDSHENCNKVEAVKVEKTARSEAVGIFLRSILFRASSYGKIVFRLLALGGSREAIAFRATETPGCPSLIERRPHRFSGGIDARTCGPHCAARRATRDGKQP